MHSASAPGRLGRTPCLYNDVVCIAGCLSLRQGSRAQAFAHMLPLIIALWAPLRVGLLGLHTLQLAVVVPQNHVGPVLVVAAILLTNLAAPSHVEDVGLPTMLAVAVGPKGTAPRVPHPVNGVARVVVTPSWVRIKRPARRGAPGLGVGWRRRMGRRDGLHFKGERRRTCDSRQRPG